MEVHDKKDVNHRKYDRALRLDRELALAPKASAWAARGNMPIGHGAYIPVRRLFNASQILGSRYEDVYIGYTLISS